MARKQLTPEQQAAKVAKMKATKAANQAAALKTMGLETYDRSKPKRKKRQMSDAQKEAAVARLAKARAAKGPSVNNQIDEDVRNLPDDDLFSVKNVRHWQTEAKNYLQSIKSFKDSKSAAERSEYQQTETYIVNLGTYLRTGVYQDHRFGAERTGKVQLRSVKLAYYPDGRPKRSVGVYYPDLGEVYTQEMYLQDA